METRILRIIKNKDGHGTINYKVTLPKSWIERMGISENLELKFDGNKIIIENMENKKMNFKTDKRFKKLEIGLYGTSYDLPFTELEKYTDTKIENLGENGELGYIIDGDHSYKQVYKYKDNLYIIDTIKHYNTELISATLLQLVEC